LLLVSAKPEGWSEAAQWIATPGRELPTAADARLSALLAIRRPARSHAQASLAWEQFVLRGRNQAAEGRLVLARAYEQESRDAAAREAYFSLAAAISPDPTHVAATVDFLLRQGEPKQAQTWLTVLERLQPRSERTQRLRHRWTELTPSDENMVSGSRKDSSLN
jgi:hypothetical protein